MSRSYRWSIAVAATLAFTAPLSAQQVPAGDAVVAPITAFMRPVAPLVSLVPVPALESTLTETLPSPSLEPIAPAMTQSQSVALMIVGGAAMIVGSLIDGDSGTIIMVGGGVAGLIGLFQYLR